MYLCIYLFLIILCVCRFYSNRDQAHVHRAYIYFFFFKFNFNLTYLTVSGEQFSISNGFLQCMTPIGIGKALLIAMF